MGVGGLNEAEDLSVLPVNPVAQIADVVAALSLQISLMSFATSSKVTAPSRLWTSM